MADAFYTVTFTIGPVLVALVTIGIGTLVRYIRRDRNR